MGGRRQSPFGRGLAMEPVIPSNDPPDLPECLDWRTVKVPPGINGPFMVAGPAWHGEAHFVVKRTLPCPAKLRGCKLQCPYCHKVRRFACYVPLYSLKTVKNPRMVIQGAKRTLATFKAFKVGDLVNVVRGKLERDTPLFTAAGASAPTVDLDKFKRRGSFDVTPYLLHLWQWRELTESFGQLFRPSIHTIEIEAGMRSLEDDGPREHVAE